MPKGPMKVVKALLRMLLGLTALLASLAVILPIAAYFFLDPNDYRPQIAAFIAQKTELPLTINGPIEFQLFPWVGLKAQKIALLPENSPQEEFIHIEELGFQIPLRELMRSNLQIESLLLKGMQIHLIKHANGSANWDILTQKINKKPANPSSQEDPQSTQSKKLKFAIINFAVENATLYYHDQQENQTVILDKLDIQGKQSQEMIYPVKGKFALVLQKAQDKQPTLKGHGQFSGQTKLATKTLLANLHTEFSGQAAALGQQNVHLNSDVDINPATTISLKNLHLSMADAQVTGRCTIPMDSKLPITFNLNLNQLNLDKLHLAQASDGPSLAQSSPTIVKTKATKRAPIKPLKSAKQSRALSGEVTIRQLIAQGLTLTNVKSHINKDGSLLKLNPLKADFYQGSLTAQVTKDLANSNSPTYLQGTLRDVQILPLLKALKQFEKVTGTAVVNFNMHYQNRQGFNGTTQFHLKQGTFKGVDVNYYVNMAQSLLKKETPTVADTKITPFDNLKGTLNINNNIIYNPDLQADSHDYKAAGEGSINLNTQAIAYKVQAARQYYDNKEHPNAYPLALRIKGTIEHPIVEPDLDLYLKTAAKREIKKQLNKQLERQLGKILGEDKTKTATESTEEATENTQKDDKSAQDKLQEKIEKEIGKGLKKILKF